MNRSTTICFLKNRKKKSFSSLFFVVIENNTSANFWSTSFKEIVPEILPHRWKEFEWLITLCRSLPKSRQRGPKRKQNKLIIDPSVLVKTRLCKRVTTMTTTHLIEVVKLSSQSDSLYCSIIEILYPLAFRFSPFEFLEWCVRVPITFWGLVVRSFVRPAAAV